MIFIYLIIFVISIDGIITTNVSKNDRVILIASCQANTSRLELIPIPSDHQYYFYSSIQSSSTSLSPSSPSSLPLLHLSYCEHQQTSSYYSSSSGFAILRSSPRFLLTDIVNKQHSSSFHHHNVVLSEVDQLSSTSSNTTVTTLMSSSTDNNMIVDSDKNNPNLISTTIKSLLSTTFSNVSLFETSLSTTTQKGNRAFNIMLLIGCITTGGILILLIIYAIIKHCNRDEGSYKIDESQNFAITSYLDKPNNDSSTGKTSSSSHHRQKLLRTNEQTIGNSREWYV